ncbi:MULTISPECIES: sigma-54 dependent transcriptional regulator [unclassified Sphingomonas]|uniref:sigma-54 interaction domain-containing protein n=1 Tax=unclassified Sphingomonas TaxID=196159 RepID=UPI00285A2475|nr:MULTISPECIES: sigma-54 dependent transcriptional regulator [unclassified Sphingomonas]MDR6114063.1 two-component system response regulator FlrC [Sphingomonas sp. SORGH_AS_0789]MDR6148577.1 two-component system response regulator FlrC [Sphingomonas sp. SORGH_AS_0742]
MSSIFPSAALVKQKYALISALRAQGLAIADSGAVPQAGDMFLLAEGDPVEHPARSVVVIDGPVPAIVPASAGRPATVTYSAAEAGVGNSFVRALVAGPTVPTAADPESLALFTLAERVAQSDITVLINGPTGTGKEVVARAIHAQSARAAKPFVAINCAALPESMLEALLFGHQKGAFTGAAQAGEGFFRAADGGTLLLDEIAEMPLQLQAKLLRVLQEREVIPLGASMPQSVDVRVIACANRDLQAEVAAGRFRADLYYRLSVFPLTTKALGERRMDIPALAATMILRHAAGRTVMPWPSTAAIEKLAMHNWPGNVRELENVIQRALLFAGGATIEAEHIVFDRPMVANDTDDMPLTVTTAEATLGKVVQMSEFAAIREMLAACGGNRVETAKRLGISERTLRYRLAKAREQGEEIIRPSSRAMMA